MLTSILFLLAVFYAGAILASARAWFRVWRGRAGFADLRDVTGIGDPVALRRLFGLTRADGSYPVALADILRHRRPAGVILTNLPVHLMFAAALAFALADAGSPAAAAIAWAASAHASVLTAVALAVFAAGRQALPD